jgi:hypothetical protein
MKAADMVTSGSVWCFVCDEEFTNGEDLAHHVAESRAHQDNEKMLTLPHLALLDDEETRERSPSSQKPDNLAASVDEGTIRRAVTAALTACGGGATRRIEDGMRIEMERVGVPPHLRSALVAAASVVFHYFRDSPLSLSSAEPSPSTSGSPGHDVAHLSSPASAVGRDTRGQLLTAAGAGTLLELFDPGDDLWDIDDHLPVILQSDQPTEGLTDPRSPIVAWQTVSRPNVPTSPPIPPPVFRGIPAMSVETLLSGRTFALFDQRRVVNAAAGLSRTERRRRRAIDRGYMKPKRR